MRPTRPLPAIFLLAGSLLPSALLADPARAALWKAAPPGEIPATQPGADPHGRLTDASRLTDVAVPTLTRFNPEKPNGRALIVCPGGGYGILAFQHEGDAVAQRYAKDGITTFVLHYRVPVKSRDAADAAPRLDLAEALRQVRATLVAEGFAQPKIGVLGFSAGGHLALESAYGPMPEGAPRPDFAVAVYPAYLLDPSGELKAEFAPLKNSPPACFVHAADDPHPAAGSAKLWTRLNQVGVPAELHIFAVGGHGFGLSEKTKNKPVDTWPNLVEAWMKKQ